MILILLQIYINIDLGGENIRASTIDIYDQAILLPNKFNKFVTPGAAAIKLKNPINETISNDLLSTSQFKYGFDALKYLKNHPESGTPYLGRLIGRNSSENYPLPINLTPVQLLSLFFIDLFSSPKLSTVEGTSVTIPCYYTLKQREEVIQALWAAKIPFLGLIDDYTAVIQLYSEKFHSRYQNNNHTVLFIDIGATHISSYRVDFYFNSSIDQFANQTSLLWTEETGTLEFARKISKIKKISLNKAKRILDSGLNISEFIKEDLNIISNLILKSLHDTVDEIQIFGGGSKLPFLIDFIKQITNFENIFKELPSFDTTVLGGAYLSLQLSNSTNEINKIFIERKPAFTMNVTCGNVTGEYCVENDNCTELVILDNTICEYLDVVADINHIPFGSSPLLSRYIMKNISKFEREEDEIVSGIISLANPLPIIVHTSWCITAIISCQQIDIQQYDQPINNYKILSNFVDEIQKIERKRRRIQSLKSQILDLSQQISNNLINSSNIKFELNNEYIQSLFSKVDFIINNDIEIFELENLLQQLKDLNNKFKF